MSLPTSAGRCWSGDKHSAEEAKELLELARPAEMPSGVEQLSGSADWLTLRADPERKCRLRVSTGYSGYLARSNWNTTFRRAADAIGLPAVRSHELRHTGATLAAATGATTKELMRRLGHSSPAAALLYQHAADDRDGEIARALDAMLGAASELSDDDPDRRG
ncbi:tyrosine-type recombinase/integrase [Geodermatophilus amargosae]|uniref:tyrosine-type recombinase/integrase n=1 Tax=Geodermatophilus amargosae TaxID=1296565 RepID=UPI0034DF1F53